MSRDFRGRCNTHEMAQVMMQSSGGASDRAPFFGAKMPPEIKKLVQLSRNVDRSTYGNVLKCKVHNHRAFAELGQPNVHSYVHTDANTLTHKVTHICITRSPTYMLLDIVLGLY